MIDINRLRFWCDSSKTTIFTHLAKIGFIITDTPAGLLAYKNNNSQILAVGHADIVPGLESYKSQKYDDLFVSPALDDRLGLYIIVELLSNVDILITDNEEIGQSTAQFFETEKNYNWMFQLDRHGYDVVLYQYDSSDSRQYLKDFNVGKGTFSDICYLDHLECIGFNFGIGYYFEHTEYCNCDIQKVNQRIAKIENFLVNNSNISMPYICDDSLYNDLDILCEYCIHEIAEYYDSLQDVMVCDNCRQFLGIPKMGVDRLQ